MSDRIIQVFKNVDAHSTGQIPREVLKHVLSQLDANAPDTTLESFLDAASMPKSGLVDYEYFLKWVFALQPDKNALTITRTLPTLQLWVDPRQRENLMKGLATEVPKKPPLQYGSFRLEPVNATIESIKAAYDSHIARTDSRFAKAFGGWTPLKAALQEQGAEAAEWFWLFRCNPSIEEQSEADGLVIFRLTGLSTKFGQLLHLSLVGETLNTSDYAEALEAVKNHMFTHLPIRSIRVTLSFFRYGDSQDERVWTDIEQVLKSKFFRWFRLCNAPGLRMQEFNRPRGQLEDGDPEQPAEAFSVEVCLGQAWLRRATSTVKPALKFARCAPNLLVAGLCLNKFWALDASKEVKKALLPATIQNARAGLVQGLLSGSLQNLLATYLPVARHESSCGSAQEDPAMFTHHIGRIIQGTGTTVEGVQCESSEDAAGLLQRLSSAPGYAEASHGLGVEDMVDKVASMPPQDAVFGRLFVKLDWHTSYSVNSETFEVPVDVVGSCPGHPHPIIYLATGDNELYVILIPMTGVATLHPENAFGACVEMLRASQPTTAPFSSIRLTNFATWSPVESSEISDSKQLGLTVSTQVSEFGSLLVSGGREMPGKLKPSSAGGKPFILNKPFIFALWHTGIDEINVPLAVTLIA